MLRISDHCARLGKQFWDIPPPSSTALQACISLNAMYDEARQRNEPMPNEGEFRAYHLMLLMGTHGKYKYNSTEYRKALKVGDT